MTTSIPARIVCAASVGFMLLVTWFGAIGCTALIGCAEAAPLSPPALELLGESTGLTHTESPTHTLSFDGNVAYEFALDQCEMGPRPTGTSQGWALGDYIITQLRSAGWSVYTQEFTHEQVPCRNIIGSKGSGPIVMLGAHYDTRPIADRDAETPDEAIVGANDGASGVAVLLELARVLEDADLNWQVWLTFFDAEDRGRIDGWPYAVGSAYMAKRLADKPRYMILVDMVGDLDQGIYFEANSDPGLLKDLWGIAHELGYGDYFIPEQRWTIFDDHVPFARQGIPSVDLIDFDYPYWHTTEDTCDKIGPASLERVGRVIERWLVETAADPVEAPALNVNGSSN